MMGKMRVIQTAALMMIVLFAFTGVAFAGKNATIFWKTATLAPEGIGWSKQMKTIVFPEIEKITEGNLAIKVYYGGVMGDDIDVIKKMKIGQLNGAGLAAQGANQLCPEFQVLELPFLFNDFDEVDYIRDRMSGTFDKIFEKHGFFMLAWTDQDFDQIYSTKVELAKVADFKRGKFITWYGPVEQDLFKVLGANQIPVGVPEVGASIRSGVADSAIGPALWIVGAQMHSVVRYMNRIKIRYSPAAIVVTDKTFKALPTEYQKRYYEVRGPLLKKFSKAVRGDLTRSMEALIKYGIKDTKMAPADLAEMKKVTSQVWGNMTGKIFTKALLDEVLANLKTYRASKGK